MNTQIDELFENNRDSLIDTGYIMKNITGDENTKLFFVKHYLDYLVDVEWIHKINLNNKIYYQFNSDEVDDNSDNQSDDENVDDQNVDDQSDNQSDDQSVDQSNDQNMDDINVDEQTNNDDTNDETNDQPNESEIEYTQSEEVLDDEELEEVQYDTILEDDTFVDFNKINYKLVYNKVYYDPEQFSNWITETDFFNSKFNNNETFFDHVLNDNNLTFTHVFDNYDKELFKTNVDSLIELCKEKKNYEKELQIMQNKYDQLENKFTKFKNKTVEKDNTIKYSQDLFTLYLLFVLCVCSCLVNDDYINYLFTLLQLSFVTALCVFRLTRHIFCSSVMFTTVTLLALKLHV